MPVSDIEGGIWVKITENKNFFDQSVEPFFKKNLMKAFLVIFNVLRSSAWLKSMNFFIYNFFRAGFVINLAGLLYISFDFNENFLFRMLTACTRCNGFKFGRLKVSLISSS